MFEDDLRQAKERERKRQDEERAAELQKRKIEKYFLSYVLCNNVQSIQIQARKC